MGGGPSSVVLGDCQVPAVTGAPWPRGLVAAHTPESTAAEGEARCPLCWPGTPHALPSLFLVWSGDNLTSDFRQHSTWELPDLQPRGPASATEAGPLPCLSPSFSCLYYGDGRHPSLPPSWQNGKLKCHQAARPL